MDVSGVYVHVPFCRKACHYCNFHFSTSLKAKGKLVDAIVQEIRLRASTSQLRPLESIYFGGGTPSLLSKEELQSIFQELARYYNWNADTEITLEANPEDVHPTYLEDLLDLGVNRLSVGIQSFRQDDLLHMNRAHDVADSLRCITDIKNAGFSNYTIDLMFGLINSDNQDWAQNIETALSYTPPHMSCYNLTLEEQTVYAKWEKDGKINQESERLQKEQYEYASEVLQNTGYNHYEVSNYAIPGYEAIHNSNYWQRKAYVGYGPSAHSYNTDTRSWNIANNAIYMKAISSDSIPLESEVLQPIDYYNEIVMLGLRTARGISDNLIDKLPAFLSYHWYEEVDSYLQDGRIFVENGYYRLRRDQWYISDNISSALFYVD